MNLSEYFATTKGYGVLATADSSGKVNAAIYGRPYFVDEKTAIFVMAERLTHANLQSNPHAAYLFIQSGQGYSGKRLHLTRIREESNDELVETICLQCDYTMLKGQMTRRVVFFSIDAVLPLIGPGP